MTSSIILYEKRPDGVAVVTINRPEVLNALDIASKERLAEVWLDAQADQGVRAIVFTGAGDRAFCVGSDVKEMQRTGQAVPTDLLLRSLPGVAAPLDKPVIAALQGHCLGLGLTMAIHCDLRLATESTALGFPEVKGGGISGVNALRLVQIIPAAQAMELLLLGETIGAAEAERIGLINRVVWGDVVEEALRWAAKIASNTPAAVQAMKRMATLGTRRVTEAEQAEIDRLRRWVRESQGAG